MKFHAFDLGSTTSICRDFIVGVAFMARFKRSEVIALASFSRAFCGSTVSFVEHAMGLRDNSFRNSPRVVGRNFAASVMAFLPSVLVGPGLYAWRTDPFIAFDKLRHYTIGICRCN
ncbi:MAG: hypothetical protein ACRCT6_12680 [Notoacmeibacter sp.]